MQGPLADEQYPGSRRSSASRGETSGVSIKWPGHLAAQAGAAAVLGTVLTPAAAILAFVDGGLAKDANCSAVVGEGEGHTGAR